MVAHLGEIPNLNTVDLLESKAGCLNALERAGTGEGDRPKASSAIDWVKKVNNESNENSNPMHPSTTILRSSSGPISDARMIDRRRISGYGFRSIKATALQTV